MLSDSLTTDPGAWLVAHKSLMRNRRSPPRRLDPVERDVLSCYINLDMQNAGCGFTINRQLRSQGRGDPVITERIACMDGVLNKSRPLPDSIRYLYRGISGKSIRKIPAVGSVYADAAYMSTSPLLPRALLYAGRNPVILRIDTENLKSTVYSPNEEEIVLDRGIIWRVTSVHRNIRVDPRMARHPRDPDTDLSYIIPQRVTVIDLCRSS